MYTQSHKCYFLYNRYEQPISIRYAIDLSSSPRNNFVSLWLMRARSINDRATLQNRCETPMCEPSSISSLSAKKRSVEAAKLVDNVCEPARARARVRENGKLINDLDHQQKPEFRHFVRVFLPPLHKRLPIQRCYSIG